MFVSSCVMAARHMTTTRRSTSSRLLISSGVVRFVSLLCRRRLFFFSWCIVGWAAAERAVNISQTRRRAPEHQLKRITDNTTHGWMDGWMEMTGTPESLEEQQERRARSSIHPFLSLLNGSKSLCLVWEIWEWFIYLHRSLYSSSTSWLRSTSFENEDWYDRQDRIVWQAVIKLGSELSRWFMATILPISFLYTIFSPSFLPSKLFWP